MPPHADVLQWEHLPFPKSKYETAMERAEAAIAKVRV